MQDSRGFYRSVESWQVSSLGIGTYLGGLDEAADAGYQQTLAAALNGGINFIDTSLNYRHQRSERAIGDVLRTQKWPRESLVICTKAGYLVPGAIPEEAVTPADIVLNMHCMAPGFLRDQCRRSLANLGIDTIDVFYLHNPETQLSAIHPDEFLRRCRRAFETCEEMVTRGAIRFYGMATWEGFRKQSGGLDLIQIVEMVKAVAGSSHHFRFVQAPFNFAMTEILTLSNQVIGGKSRTLIEAAAELDINVIASASLLQSRLSRDLPDPLRAQFPGLHTDAQCAIQFARSAPGISVALVGMSNPAHLRENLETRNVAPLSTEEFARLFRS